MKWAGRASEDKENWPKSFCQEKEVEPEQAISAVVTETKAEQAFDWDRYSSFKRIRNLLPTA